ncbi:Mitochondrial ribosomal small subunit component [Lachancea thermotolerans]
MSSSFVEKKCNSIMLYELVSIVRVVNPLSANTEAKELATTIGKLIIQNRGVVRRVLPVGNKLLPKIIKKDQEQHFQGYHFLMLFDSSAAVQSEILRTLKKDPRVIRSSIVKVDTSKQLDVASSIERAAGYSSILEKVKKDAF